MTLGRGSQTRGEAQEVNQWHCQTGLLLAWSVAENSFLQRENKNFSKPGGSVTSPSAAAIVGQCAALSKGLPVCIKMAPGKCTRSIVPSVEPMPWCHSALEVTVRFTVVIASARCAPSLQATFSSDKDKVKPETGLAKCQSRFCYLSFQPFGPTEIHFETPLH